MKDMNPIRSISFNNRVGVESGVVNGAITQLRQLPSDRLKFGYEDILDYASNCAYKCSHESERDFLLMNSKYSVGEFIVIKQRYEDICEKHEDVHHYWEVLCKKYNVSLGNLHAIPGWKDKRSVDINLMPLAIQITNIRIERIQRISDNDCLCSGISSICTKANNSYGFFEYRKSKRTNKTSAEKHLGLSIKDAYSIFSNKIFGDGVWDENPLVFVYDFKLIKNPYYMLK